MSTKDDAPGSAAPGSNDKRRDERLKVAWSGRLTTASGEEFPCDVLDISQAGALIKSSIRTNVDEDLLLSIETLGDFAGRVKWQGEEALGVLLLAGPDLSLKKFAVKSGAALSTRPEPEKN